MTKSKLPHPLKCSLYHDLWTDRSWVHRRIDEITFTERGMMQVKSTFDLDISYLKQKINRLPQELRKDDQIALPLMALPRTLLLDIDVMLDGKPQSFASTETSADITNYIYIQEYFNKHITKSNNCDGLSPRNGWPSKLSDEIAYVSNLMHCWFKQGGSEYIDEQQRDNHVNLEKYKTRILELKDEKTLKGESSTTKYFDQDITSLYKKFEECNNKILTLDLITSFGNDEDPNEKSYEWEEWSRFAKDYIAVVLIDLPSDRQRAKLTYVTKTDLGYQEDAIRLLPVRPSAIPVRCRSLLGSGIEKRYHFRVNAPEGHYISSLSLTDARDDNNEVFFQLNTPPMDQCSKSKERAKLVTCETASGADLTFLEIKDNTDRGKGNIFGYMLNIGVEPFPQTFIFRALVSIFFLLSYLLVARFLAFETGRIVPFSIAALGFLASSPLWFRIGSEDAFTHHTLRWGRTILAILSAAVFLISFGVQLVNEEMRAQEGNSRSNSCFYVFNADHQIFDEQYVCNMGSALSSKKIQNFVDHSWELIFVLCMLYILGIFWFFFRTHSQKKKFKHFLKQLNSEDQKYVDCQSFSTKISKSLMKTWQSFLTVVLLNIIVLTILLSGHIFILTINDISQVLLESDQDYIRDIYACSSIITLVYMTSLLFTRDLLKNISIFTKNIRDELLSPTNEHRLRSRISSDSSSLK